MKAPPKSPQATPETEEFERPAGLTCPECGGALRQAGGGAVSQYRCHIGHRFAPEEVLDGQFEEVDRALGVALRVLNERIELCRQMAENARAGGRSMGVTHWRRLQNEAEEQLHVLQQFLMRAPSRATAEDGNSNRQSADAVPERSRA